MTFHGFLLLLSFFFLLCLVWLWPFDWSEHELPHLAAKTAGSVVHRLLQPRCPNDGPACRRAIAHSSVVGPAPAPVRPMVRDEKPPGSAQAGEHRGLRLSQSPMPLLRDHRCSHACTRWRWQAGACRAHPDLSRSGLPEPVHFQAPHALVPFENAFPADRHGADLARACGLDASEAPRIAGLPTSHHYDLADSRGLARSVLAQACFQPSAPATPPLGRIAHQTAQPEAGAVAVAGQ
jgi:hypothetical protein